MFISNLFKTASLVGTVALLLSAFPASAQEAPDYFRTHCTSCHTIGGGRLTGPDLKGVTSQKPRQWFVNFIMDPRGTLDSGDPYALQLQQESRGAVMTNFPDMTRSRAEALLNLIEAESKLKKSHFIGSQLSARPFTPKDIAEGNAIFNGAKRLKNGGPPCLSCHTTAVTGSLGGGRLGPDLTQVFARLGGRKAFGAWLASPATETMRSVFKKHPMEPEEIIPLLAYFKRAAQTGKTSDLTGQVNFLLLGLLGACLVLALFGALWKNRFRGVRSPMVKGAQTQHE